GDRRQAEALGQVDDRAHDLGVAGVALHGAHERTVDLDLVEVKLAEVVEAGIAGAEIVEGNLDADILEGAEGRAGRADIGDQRGFRDLDFQTPRRKIRLGKDGEYLHRQQRIGEVERRHVDRDGDVRGPVARVETGTAQQEI